MSIPATSRISARPVWKRHMMRTMRNIEQMPPPTDEEKHDAILVLSDPENEVVYGLWDEAHRILDEAGR